MKKKNFVIISIFVLVLLITSMFFSIISDSFTYKFFIKSRKDYSKEYREEYQTSNYPFLLGVVQDVILTSAEKEGRKFRIPLKKGCSEWSKCHIRQIFDYLGNMKSLDFSFEVSQDKELEAAILNLYSEWKRNHLNENGILLREPEDETYILVMKFSGLLSEDERKLLLTEIYKGILKQEVPSEIQDVNIYVLRVGLDIRNIDHLVKELEELSKESYMLGLDYKKLKNVLCSRGIITKSDFVGSKTQNLWELYYYISQKDFCKIPRTKEDEKLIESITSENYLNIMTLHGEKYISYTSEFVKYLIINSDRIFAD